MATLGDIGSLTADFGNLYSLKRLISTYNKANKLQNLNFKYGLMILQTTMMNQAATFKESTTQVHHLSIEPNTKGAGPSEGEGAIVQGHSLPIE